MLLALDKFLPAHRHPIEAHIFLAHTPLAVTLFFIFHPQSSVWISVEASYQFLFGAIEKKGKEKKSDSDKKKMCECADV